MAKEIRVVIVEDDPYSRDLMALVLTRDWRTQVIGEVGDFEELDSFIKTRSRNIDVIVLDSEHPGGSEWPFEIASFIEGKKNAPVILDTGTRPNLRVSRRVADAGRGGYVLKNEILYALPSAVSLAYSRQLVLTPGIWSKAPRKTFPGGTLILDGRKISTNLTRREQEMVRLALIFNLSIRDIADELVLSQGWVSEIVSTVYRKLGMREILSGEVPLDAYFEDASVLRRCEQILSEGQAKEEGAPFRKGPWMATLAFHLITQPRIREY
jgi:DNA-binding NarL/FixJ family response regulator